MADYRLPTTVRPTHYQLAVKTDLAATPASFSAEAIIDLAVDETTSSIVFNLHPSLSVTHIALASGDLEATAIPTSALSVDAETERATLDLGAVGGGLTAGVHGAKLFVRWEAELGGNMMGYYKSNGDADEHGNRPMWVTHLRALAKPPATRSPNLSPRPHAAPCRAGTSHCTRRPMRSQ